MKKTLRYIFVFGLLTVSALGQQMRSRVFDNFDTVRGVQVLTPTVAPITETKSKSAVAANKKLVKKTAQVSMSAQEGVGLKGASYIKSSMAAGKSLGGFTTGDDAVDSYIVDSCRRYAIDPLLIYSQMHQESSFKSKAMSYKGARGLMQLMPATAVRLGVRDIYDPKQNIEGGIKYMRLLLDMFSGDVALALAGYNAGEGAVLKYGRQVPPYRETQEYVRRITNRYNSITNPSLLAQTVRKVSSEQIVRLEEKAAAPLATYESNAVAIKLADGRMRLVNQ